MKTSRVLSILLCMSFAAVLFLPRLSGNVWGQEEKTKVEDKSGEPSTTKEKFSEEKKEFKRKAKARLDELDKKIAVLESESKKAGSKVKAEAKEGLRELRKKSSSLKKEMRKLEAGSRTKWEEAKQKMQKAQDNLEEEYNKVRDKFKSE